MPRNDLVDRVACFPFGQQVRILEQTDRTPKKVFVLGVYASAVHARWIGRQGETLSGALAVASEPYIFWRGERADEIVAEIPIPAKVGRLEPAAAVFNGPSGKALDELYLKPLGLTREDAWLCDLVPHSCMNAGQKRAMQRVYSPLREKYDLPMPTIPELPRVLADERRCAEIAQELSESKAEVLILLGDQPIKWFLARYDNRWSKLSDFGENSEEYGKLHKTTAFGRDLDVLPLVHPRQAGKLGASSMKWGELHQAWLEGKTAIDWRTS